MPNGETPPPGCGEEQVFGHQQRPDQCRYHRPKYGRQQNTGIMRQLDGTGDGSEVCARHGAHHGSHTAGDQLARIGRKLRELQAQSRSEGAAKRCADEERRPEHAARATGTQAEETCSPLGKRKQRKQSKARQ